MVSFVHATPTNDFWHMGYARIGLNTGSKYEQLSVHRLVAIAEYGLDEVSNKIVHHVNGCPYDNRPENLEVMTQGEHIRLHEVTKSSTREQKYNDEEIIDHIVKLWMELGREPSYREFNQSDGPHSTTVVQRFGGWMEGKELAQTELERLDVDVNSDVGEIQKNTIQNLTSMDTSRHWSKEKCIDHLLRVTRILGKYPTQLEYLEHKQDGPACPTIRSKCGSWKTAERIVSTRLGSRPQTTFEEFA